MIIDEQEFLSILVSLEIGNQEFFQFLEGKVKRYPVNDFGWGCFPILDNDNHIIDIRIIVPDFLDELCIRINIHEYTHAFELYNELGEVYIENRVVRENNAKEKELEFLRLRSKKF